MMTKSTQITIVVLGAILWGLSSSLAQTPDRLEYSPKTYVSAEAKQGLPCYHQGCCKQEKRRRCFRL